MTGYGASLCSTLTFLFSLFLSWLFICFGSFSGFFVFAGPSNPGFCILQSSALFIALCFSRICLLVKQDSHPASVAVKNGGVESSFENYINFFSKASFTKLFRFCLTTRNFFSLVSVLITLQTISLLKLGILDLFSKSYFKALIHNSCPPLVCWKLDKHGKACLLQSLLFWITGSGTLSIFCENF